MRNWRVRKVIIAVMDVVLEALSLAFTAALTIAAVFLIYTAVMVLLEAL